MRFLRRVSRWIQLRTHTAELRDELTYHRELIEREYIARGLSPHDARDAAHRAMGNETFMREESRGVWVWPWLEALAQDARFTIRSLRNSPGFSVAVVLTLALGLGANAAMFSVIDRLFFRSPPLLDQPALTHRVYLYRTYRGVEAERSGQYLRYTDLVRWTTSFSRTAAVAEPLLAVGRGDAVRELPVAVVTAGFFGFFDAPPALGRYFTAAEDVPPTGATVAVLSNATWRARYGARDDVLGAKLQIGAATYTIIGVAPDGFVGLWPERPPVAFIPVTAYGGMHGSHGWWSSYDHAIGITMIARRKPEVTIAAANADLTAALRRSYQAQLDAEPSDGSRTLVTLRPRAVASSILSERGPEASSVTRVAAWLSAVALIVLLIACANVANLLLARAMRRRRELAVRVALGVGRARLATQLLTESVLLALAGGAVGIIIAHWASDALHAVFLPGVDETPVITDFRTAAFASAITLTVGMLAGLIPGLQVGRVDLTDDLKSGAREGTYPRSRLRSALLVGQSALCVTLLVGAGLFVRSLRNVRDVRLGYDVDPVLVVDVNMRGVSLDSAQRVALDQRLLAATQTIPGVERASLMKTVPFEGISSWPLFVAGIDSVDTFGEFDLNGVSPEYFATLGTRMVRGRGIEAADVARTRRVMVIGQSMAATLWPAQDPIGRCVRIGADTAPCTSVVGIAEDVHTRSLGDERGVFMYYLPVAQMTPDDVGLFVRARTGVAVLEPLRRRLQQEMPGASYVVVRPFRDVIRSETQAWRVGATAFTVFGALAMLLAALGLYGVIAYGVTQRTHELGIRMALGAHAFDVVKLVVNDGLRFVTLGMLIGCGISVVFGSWVAPLLFKESPRDPLVFMLVALTLIVTAIAASAIPAVRAVRVDPRTALQAG
ncbi:MAG TPA: ADOP family duplicated permease [Gemmatimonadaceae bacterium]|jgi:predicted permease